MPNPQLDQFIHALMWKAGSTIILCGIAALLLREFLNWIERRGGRGDSNNVVRDYSRSA